MQGRVPGGVGVLRGHRRRVPQEQPDDREEYSRGDDAAPWALRRTPRVWLCKGWHDSPFLSVRLLIVRVSAAPVVGQPQRLRMALPRHPLRPPASPTAFAVVQSQMARAIAYSPGMRASAWSRLMASQQLLLLSAIMSMVLFAVVTIPADVRHALSTHQPLNWAV